MIINLNWMVAFLGCAILAVFWLWQYASGVRGFLWTLSGIFLIIGATLYEQDASILTSPGGMTVLASLALVLLFLCFSKLSSIRRQRRPRYQAPETISGRCSSCAQQGQLKRSDQGWLCVLCARRRETQAA